MNNKNNMINEYDCLLDIQSLILALISGIPLSIANDIKHPLYIASIVCYIII